MINIACEQLQNEMENERLRGVEAMVGKANVSDCQVLFNHLVTEPSAFVRRKIINLMGSSASGAVASEAAEALSSPEAVIRNAALEVLYLQGEKALPVLADLIKSPLQDTRKMAADALGMIKGPVAVDLLISGLKDSDTNVVIACAEALGIIGSAKAVPAMEEVLIRNTNFWSAFALLEALSKLNNGNTLRIIDEHIDQRKWSAQETVILLQHWSAAAVTQGDRAHFEKALGMYAACGLSAANLVEIIYGYVDRGLVLDIGRKGLRNLVQDAIRNASGLKAVFTAGRYFPGAVWGAANLLADQYGGTVDARERLAGLFLLIDPTEEKVCELLQGNNENAIKTMALVAEQSDLVIPADLLGQLTVNADMELLTSLIMLLRRCEETGKIVLQGLCTHSDEEIRKLAQGSIDFLDTAGDSEELLNALVHPNGEMRVRAVKGLLALHPAAFHKKLGALFKQSPEGMMPDILEVAIGWGLPEVEEMINMALAAGDAEVREKIARLLQKLENGELLLHAVNTLINDPAEEVRRAVIISLAHRKGERIHEILEYLYTYDPCRENRYYILNCDEIFAPEHAKLTWAWLEENLETSERLLQMAAIKGLSRAGEQGHRFLVQFAKSDRCDDVIGEFIRQQLVEELFRNVDCRDAEALRFMKKHLLKEGRLEDGINV